MTQLFQRWRWLDNKRKTPFPTAILQARIVCQEVPNIEWVVPFMYDKTTILNAF